MEKNSRKKREESGLRSSAKAMAAAVDRNNLFRRVLVKSSHDRTIQFLLTRTFGFSSF